MKFYDKNLREVFGETLLELGEQYQNVVVLDADLNTSTRTSLFKEKYPARFIQCAIAEANMFGVAAGMAHAGFIPFPTTFAAFVHRKALDSVYMNICCQNLNVKIAGSYPGMTAAECGPSHNSAEDIAVMRSLPNISVIAPGDNRELKSAMHAMMRHDGPVYFRAPKAEVPELFGGDYKFEWGKGRRLKEGRDISLLGTGMLTGICLKAAEILNAQGIDAEVIHMPSVKPIDENIILDTAKKTGKIVTIENGTIHGGFGSAVSEVLAVHHPAKMRMMGLDKGTFESAPLADLLKRNKLTPKDMAQNALEMLRTE